MTAITTARPNSIPRASSSYASEGDDLTLCRSFVDNAQAHLTHLLSSADIVLADIQTALTEIYDQARLVHARAIDRATKAALDMSENHSDFQKTTQWQGQILVLDKLVDQYAQGLAEVEEASHYDETDQSNNLLALDSDLLSKETPPETLVEFETSEERQARYEMAKETLSPLLKFTENDVDRKALKHLMALNVKASAQAVKPKTVEFEALIPIFTNAALRTARQTDKVVSVSYACDTIDIPSGKRLALETMLEIAAEWLVNCGVDLPDVRQSHGQSGAGHIAVTATKQSGSLELTLASPTLSLTHARAFPKNEALNLLSGKARTWVEQESLMLEIIVPLRAGDVSDAKLSEMRA